MKKFKIGLRERMVLLILPIAMFCICSTSCRQKLQNDADLNCVWVTWSDDGSRISYHYAYGCNNSDSVLFISGNHRFYKPGGIEYDCFKVDYGIDSIVMIDEYIEFGSPIVAVDPYKYLKNLQHYHSERISTKGYWLGGDKSGHRKRHIGYKFFDWRNE